MAVAVVVAAPIVFEDTAPITLNLNVKNINNILNFEDEKDNNGPLII